MKHLTVEEITKFVSMNELTDEALKLAATVNGHIRNCKECRELVNAYQIIYDEVSKAGFIGDFEKIVSEKLHSPIINECETDAAMYNG